MRLFQLLIALASLCIVADVSRATRVYDSLWGVSGNANNQFYDKTTYGGTVYPNPSTIVSNKSFRRQINANMICTGAQCHNGQYVCGRYGNTDCYHVEHIIDYNMRKFLPDCEKCIDVAGNKVMTWGRWNKALGGVARSNFPAAFSEKTTVYGSTMMISAIDAIQTCCMHQEAFSDVGPKPIMSMIEKSAVAMPSPGLGNSTYNADCDCDPSDPSCNTLDTCACDSASECGCDCDYDLEFIVAAPAVASADSNITKATLVLLVCATCLIMVIAAVVLMLLNRIRTVKPQPLAQQLDYIEP